eukprot:653609-Pelagomonas_calceolata.AAC.3
MLNKQVPPNLAWQGGSTEDPRAALESTQNKLSSGRVMTWDGLGGSKLYHFSVDWTKHKETVPGGPASKMKT